MGKRFQKQCNNMFCWTEQLSDAEAAEERYVKRETTQPSPAKPKAPRKSKVEAALMELDKMYENMIAAIVRLRKRFKRADRDNAEVLGRYICDQSKTQRNDAVDKKVKAANAPDNAKCPPQVTHPLPRPCGHQNEGDERCRTESSQSDAKVKHHVDTLGESASVTGLPKSSIRDIDDVGSMLIILNGDDDHDCEELQDEDSAELPTHMCNPNENQFPDDPTYIPPGLDLQLLDKRLEKLYNRPTLDDLLDQVLDEVVIKDRRKQHAEIKKRQSSANENQFPGESICTNESQSPGESTCMCIPPGLNESTRIPPSLGESARTSPGLDASTRMSPGLDESTRTPPGLDASTRMSPGLDESTRIPPGLDESTRIPPSFGESTRTPPGLDASTRMPPGLDESTRIPPYLDESTPMPPGLDLDLFDKRLDKLYNPPPMDDLLVLNEVVINDKRKQHAEPRKKQSSQSPDEPTYIPPGLDLQLLDKRLDKLYNPPTLDELLDQVLEEVVIKDRRKHNAEVTKKLSSPNESQFPDEPTYIPPGLDFQLLDKRLEKLYNPPTLDDLLDQVLEEVVIKDRRKRHTDNKKKQDESVLKFCRPFDEDIGNTILDERGC